MKSGSRVTAAAADPVALAGRRSPLVAALFFVSGALALVYETIWQRQFALVFGSAAPATAAVLAAYFAGLGVGAFAIGKRSKRDARPLRTYALLEAGVGVGAVLVGPLLRALDAVYPWLIASFSNQSELLFVRTIGASIALLIPTFCMGGTLPVLGEWIDRTHQRLGVTAGWLYVVNTLGAGIGALAVPFVLLPRIGMSTTVWICAGINGLLALAAWQIDRRSEALPVIQTSVRATISEQNPPRTSSWLIYAFISGVVTFALQVLWNRAFAQVHEGSMYSFAIIVAVVIFALAIGGQIARVVLRRGADPQRTIGTAWLIAGILVIAGPWLFWTWSHGLSYLPTSEGWSGGAQRLLKLASALLLLPTVLLGIGLPAIMEEAGRKAEQGTAQVLGRLLAVNVAGSVAGALVAGFVLPRWLGLWGGVIWLGALLVVAGLWQRISAGFGRKHRWLGYGLVVAWLATSIPAARVSLPRVKTSTTEPEKILVVTEGAHGITAVVERVDSRRIKLNNFYGLGGTAATADERMQAHIPLLLHPAPKSVAFLGLGTGITAGGSRFHPVERMTVMELVPEVVDAARNFFGDANAHVLDDSRTRIVEDDARHHLRGSREHFDVIVGDLVVPWRQGEGSLFTLEQFQAAKAALNPKGLFCQWLPLFQLSEDELTIVIRTFLTVFPRAEIWRGDFWPNEPAIALIAGREDFAIDTTAVERRLAEMENDPTNPQVRVPEVFWMHRVGAMELGDLPTTEMRLNREDRPWIELLGPLQHGGGNREHLFVGRRLQVWLNRIRERTRTRSIMFTLAQDIGRRAGPVFEEMMLCVAEENRAGADAAQEQLKRILSETAFQKLMYR